MQKSINKIRKQFSDQWIFAFCQGISPRGCKVKNIEFDIETKKFSYGLIMPGLVQVVSISPNFIITPQGTKYHFSSDLKLDVKRPEVKFHD